MIVSYRQQMCCVNNLKVSKKPLPLTGDLQYLWLDVTKINDELHIKNHTGTRCIETQKRSCLMGMYTMSCKKILHGYPVKKILSAMPKTHHLSY